MSGIGPQVTCVKCGWVHFAVTLAFARGEVKRFNEFYRQLPPEGKECYGNKPSSLRHYNKCNLCGAKATTKQFRLTKPGDCPDGCTLSPVIWKEKK